MENVFQTVILRDSIGKFHVKITKKYSEYLFDVFDHSIFNMKFSTFFFFRLAIFILPLPTIVDAKLVMTVILNDGALPTVEGFDCNENDSQLIATTIGADDDDDGRRLMTYSKKCRDACKFYAAKTCRTTGCVGYRRRYLKQNHLDGVDDEVTCESGISTLKIGLEDMLPHLSEGCRPVVQNKLNVSCFEE